MCKNGRFLLSGPHIMIVDCESHDFLTASQWRAEEISGAAGAITILHFMCTVLLAGLRQENKASAH